MPEDDEALEERDEMHEGEEDDEDHEVPLDLLELHVAIEARDAGLL